VQLPNYVNSFDDSCTDPSHGWRSPFHGYIGQCDDHDDVSTSQPSSEYYDFASEYDAVTFDEMLYEYDATAGAINDELHPHDASDYEHDATSIDDLDHYDWSEDPSDDDRLSDPERYSSEPPPDNRHRTSGSLDTVYIPMLPRDVVSANHYDDCYDDPTTWARYHYVNLHQWPEPDNDFANDPSAPDSLLWPSIPESESETNDQAPSNVYDDVPHRRCPNPSDDLRPLYHY
jgi:hypothetical protein